MIWFTMANPTHLLAYMALHKQSMLTTGNAKPRLPAKLEIQDPPVQSPIASLTQNPTPILATPHQSPKTTLVQCRTKEVLLNRRNLPLMHFQNLAKTAS